MFNPDFDFISFHHDFAADKDDGMAVVANLVLAEYYGAKNFAFVAGAHGLNGSIFLASAPAYLDRVLGTGNWLNADSARKQSSQSLGDRWLQVLNNGGSVYIAEGGQIDFSLQTAQYVKSKGGDVSKIFVIQHSSWNINQYSAGVLNSFIALTGSAANHIKIDDGNVRNNTADLRFDTNNSLAIVDSFKQQALKSNYAREWDLAFKFYGPASVDFSDTVESLHILGVPLSQVSTILDFSKVFLPASGTPPPVTPPPPRTGAITVQAEAIASLAGGSVSAYRVERNSDASGGSMLSLVRGATNETGTASFNFTGAAANYNVVLGTFDENDGVATLKVAKNGVSIGSVLLNQNRGSKDATAATKVSLQLATGVALAPGDRITITGIENASEHARFDFIRFEPVSAPPPPPPALPVVSLALNQPSVNEDDTANLIYTFTRTGATTNPLTVNYAIGGTASNGSDYGSIGTSVTFAAGSSTATVTVNPTADSFLEPNETVALTLAPSAAYTVGTTAAVTGTIFNDDAAFFFVNDVSITKGDAGTKLATFTVALNSAVAGGASINYATVDGEAVAGSDYVATSGSLSFSGLAGETKTVSVAINGDTIVEPTETFFLNLSSPTNGVTLADGQGEGTILNDVTTAPPPPPSPQVIFQNNFDEWSVGAYTNAMVKADWNSPPWTLGITQGRANIVSGLNGNALKITMPQGKFGDDSGIMFKAPLGASYNDVMLSYNVKYEANFPFDGTQSIGGKTLGLGGGEGTGGGEPASGFDGWNARQGWQRGGIPQQYVYHVDQPTNYGEQIPYRDVVIEPGTWHEIETRIVMNTPGQNDGIIQSTFDGVVGVDRRDFNFRNTDAFSIDKVLFYTFMGGNTLGFAPPETTYITLDNIEVTANDPIIGTPPFPLTLLAYEAEALDTISGFRTEKVSAASKGSVISFVGGSTNESGKASLNFGDSPAEVSGNYQVSLRYFDESDGVGEIRLFHFDAETSLTNSIGSFKMDDSTVSGTPILSNLLTYQVPGSVLLTSGDKIVIEGYENQSEHVRIDQLILASV